MTKGGLGKFSGLSLWNNPNRVNSQKNKHCHIPAIFIYDTITGNNKGLVAMAFGQNSTLTAISIKESATLEIKDIADQILQSNIAKRADTRSVTWDCDNLVFLDLANVRIALYDHAATEFSPKIVCLAVGAVPGKTLPLHINSAKLARTLVTQFSYPVSTNTILWSEIDQAITSAVMDDFQSELDEMLHFLDAQIRSVADGSSQDSRDKTSKTTRLDEPAIEEFRHYLQRSGNVGEPVSLPLHVSLYILACTFFFMLPAFGSALLSYIWLRDGVDKSSTPT